MVFAAAGLSGLKGNDFATPTVPMPARRSRRTSICGHRVVNAASPHGRAPVERDAGSVAGFLAILAAGLLLLGVRRSRLAVATAFCSG